MKAEHPLTVYRKQHNLSRRELGDLLGVDRVSVHRWETGRRKIDHGRLPAIARLTGIPSSMLRPDLAAMLAGADQ